MTQQTSVRIRLTQVLDQARSLAVEIYRCQEDGLIDRKLTAKVRGIECNVSGWILETDRTRELFLDQHVVVSSAGMFSAVDNSGAVRCFIMLQSVAWVPEYQPEPLKVSWAEGYRPLGDETGALFLVVGRIIGNDNESKLVCAQSSVEAERIFVVDLEDEAELDDEAIRQLEVRHGTSYVIEYSYLVGKLEAQ